METECKHIETIRQFMKEAGVAILVHDRAYFYCSQCDSLSKGAILHLTSKQVEAVKDLNMKSGLE